MVDERHPVLVVEDDRDIREVMVEILESAGYAVSSASDGAEALAYLKAGTRPCIIVLDLMMPVMDGWTFSQEKQKDPELAAIPVLVVSAVGRQDPRNASMNAVAHLSKPLNVDKLMAALQIHC
jgi:CheY-like chemotaxis protein